jgi:hypothetical protein
MELVIIFNLTSFLFFLFLKMQMRIAPMYQGFEEKRLLTVQWCKTQGSFQKG